MRNPRNPSGSERGSQQRWRGRTLPAALGTLAAVMALAALVPGASGCAHDTPPPPEARSGPGQAPPPSALHVHPQRAQSAERQDRDRYECYRWAVRQTRSDPGRSFEPPPQRVRVISSRPPGADTFAGAVTGAIIGGVTSNSGEGAAIGAAVGAVVGAASDLYREQGRRELERSLEAEPPPRPERQPSNYQRALSACLEGRGYAIG